MIIVIGTITTKLIIKEKERYLKKIQVLSLILIIL